MNHIHFILPLIGFVIGWLTRVSIAKLHSKSIERKAGELLSKAEADIQLLKKNQLLEIQQKNIKEQKRAEKEIESQYRELRNRESRIQKKEDNLERRQEILTAHEENLNKTREEVETQQSELALKLQKIAHLTQNEAKRQIMEKIKNEAHQEMYEQLQAIEHRFQEQAEQRARDIIITTMQRISTDVVAEQSVVTVHLPNEEMKGRIIGKEGRNIRTLETLTGVDIIIDDTPSAVVISCFDPVRRAIAKSALEKLLASGSIHPIRIEEMVERASKEINQLMMKEAEEVLYDLNIHNMKPEGIRALGRLYFRTSYGQNILYHSREVAKIAAMIAAEIGLDVELCKRGGLLHDIGKGLVDNPELDHAHAGEELAKRLNEHEIVVEAITDHHSNPDHSHPELIVVKLADAISASRPGARSESAENYIERLENLEKIARSYEGVEKVFAVQAGRELRVIVNDNRVSDYSAKELAKNIASQIQNEMQYPGHIRVTTIRETRAVEYAK